MSSLEPLWIYITVPAAIITALVLIKLKLQKPEKHIDSIFLPDEIPAITQPLTPDESDETTDESEPVTQTIASQEAPTKPEPPTETEASDDEKPAECAHYLGFLYMRKGPERAQIPAECYQCQKLLRCLYSPRIMEKVYGS